MNLQFVLAAAIAAATPVAPAAAADHASTDDCAPTASVSMRPRPQDRRRAAALKRRVDRTVVDLSGSFDARLRPDVVVARYRARKQVDAIIRAA